MRRGESILELDPSAQDEIDRGVAEDGSNLSGVSARCSWTEMDHLFPSGMSVSNKTNMYIINITKTLVIKIWATMADE